LVRVDWHGVLELIELREEAQVRCYGERLWWRGYGDGGGRGYGREAMVERLWGWWRGIWRGSYGGETVYGDGTLLERHG
jgi:hypothetical protein